MSLETLISTYGYLAIGVGTFLEGETILVLGGFAAHQGYLSLPLVILTAFVGSYACDQLCYFVGRHWGKNVFRRRPEWETKAQRVFILLQRYETPFIIGFRFLYGLRTISPIAVGASGVAPGRFLFLNAVGGVVWAVTYGTLGYLFGKVLEGLLGDLKHYEALLLGGVVLAGAVSFGVHRWLSKRAEKRT